MEKKICPRCGGEHDLVGCPGVKAVEFGFDLNNAKTIKRVEFLTPADYGPAAKAAPDNAARADDYPKLGERKVS